MMMDLPDGENVFDDMFISFDTIHERDGHTDRQTDTQMDTTDTALRYRPHLCIASHGNET